MNLSNDIVPDARADDVRSVAFSLASMIFSNAIPPTFVDIEARVARASGINKKPNAFVRCRSRQWGIREMQNDQRRVFSKRTEQEKQEKTKLDATGRRGETGKSKLVFG